MSTPDKAFLGPDFDLLGRIHKGFNAPVMAELSDDEATALRERLVAVTSFAELDEADRELLDRACAQVDAGDSPTWQDVAQPGSDWAAEDAALEADGEVGGEPTADGGWVGA